ncbi:hypothetical protein Tco_0782438 [Tanacetum coccineum]
MLMRCVPYDKKMRRDGMACLATITSRSLSLFKSKKTHDSINNVINSIVEMRIFLPCIVDKTSQEHIKQAMNLGTIGSVIYYREIEVNVCEETLDVVGFVVGLINNTTFVNVAIFNGFVEFGNCGGNARDFGYFWDVGFAKLPMLKLREYEIWEIRIKQYVQIQDYALWEVIENGNSWVPIPVTSPAETGTSTGTKMTVPSTAEGKTCKKNDVKARSLLLMALPNEHQLTFGQYVDAQSMFAAIKARFGGNEVTKKT